MYELIDEKLRMVKGQNCDQTETNRNFPVGAQCCPIHLEGQMTSEFNEIYAHA